MTNQGDAWSHTVDQLARLLESYSSIEENHEQDTAPMVERMQVLARRIAELHVALARPTGNPAFDPEPVRSVDLKHWVATVGDECRVP